jgi:two-component system cell cycle sensor histidine kinase/response regulator CckA
MKQILVVEDEAIIARDLQRSLGLLGYAVPATARSAAEALALLEASIPELILMDIGLKGDMDGIQLAHLVRSRWDIPVIFLTSYSDEQTVERAKATGPYGYLIKPFREGELRITIEVALHKHSLDSSLARRERWYSNTMDSIGDAIIATDSEERITYMNGVAENVTGWLRQDAEGKVLREVFRLLDERGQVLECPVGQALRKGFAVQLPANTQLLAKCGNGRDVDDSAAPIVDVQGETLGGVVVFRDITERKRLEARLSVAERMASIGTMAAGMAHEINNPLAAVLGNVSYALGGLTRVASQCTGEVQAVLREALEALADSEEAGSRIMRIIDDLKRLSRLERVDRELLDLPDVIDATMRVCEHQLRHCATVHRRYGTTPFVNAAESQLIQVLTNLLINAAQAIGQGKASQERIDVRTFSDDSGNAVIEVSDTGPGISKAELGRIFDPFYSSKPIGRGMGLGLSISHNIITSLDGEITVESTPGVGTTFRIVLPAAVAPEVFPALEFQETACAPSGSRRILVVDDEPVVRRLLKRLLASHEVVLESDGRAALALLNSGQKFDLIICDLMMPDFSGVEVHEAIAASHPEMLPKMIFLTGGAFSQASTDFIETVPNKVLTKPFAAGQLLAEVKLHLG